jgi:hypothetical protein
MAFAGDSTWRWWMRGFETADKRFWRQIVLWLARRDQLTEGSVWIKIPQRRLAPGQRAEFTVGAQSPHAEPLDDLTGGAEVELPDGSRRPVSLIRQENTLCGSFRDTQTAGDYTLQVSVKHLGQAVGTARARFMVYAQDLELDNAAADTELMASLAAMTLGQRLAPEQLPELLRRLAKATNSLLVEHETKKTFWDSWPFFLLLVAILGVEWYLRKRWGLV